VADSKPFDDPHQRQARYVRALLDGSAETASQVIDELLAARHSTGEIYINVITPAMAQVGESWCRGEATVASEHLATQIALKQLDQLSSGYPGDKRDSAHRILVASVENEEHFIGARMLADLCSAKGWSVDFLGPNLPTRDLLDMIERRRPSLLALSATMEQGIGHVRRLLEELARLGEIPRVLLGGQAFANKQLLVARNVMCRTATDILHGMELARTLLQQDRPKAVLKEYLLALGRRIREFRNQKAWTQERLAEASRVTRACIIAVESGRQNVSMDIVVRIANALEISPESLLSSPDEIPQT
jgi:methanogenic corrinoid protein MtbC1/DNA-binding XRE family transcriptional regulator